MRKLVKLIVNHGQDKIDDLYPIKTKSDRETVLGQNYGLSEDVMIKTKVIGINGIK